MKRSILFFLLGFCCVASFAQTPAHPTTYALIIGVSQYKEVAPLQFAGHDAMAFASFLKTQQVPVGNIKLFLNENATRFNIVDELYNLTETLKPHDRFYFYFGGHGDLEANIEAENALLLLYNSYKKSYFQGNEYLQLSELKTWFGAMTKKQVEVIFISDACHSGGLIGGKVGNTKTQKALQESWENITKILSCKSDEFSLEGKQWGGGRGLFSYYLINGLTGRADANRDKKVDVKELSAYLTTNVQKEANPNRQTPVVISTLRVPLSIVNADALKKLDENQQKEYSLMSDATIRDINPEVISRLDTTLTSTFRRFRITIDSLHLLFPKGRNALTYYRQLDSLGIPNHIKPIIKRQLAVALLQRELIVLKVPREKGRPLIATSLAGIAELSIRELEQVINLLGPDHPIINNLKARLLVLKSQRLFPETPENVKLKRNYLLASLQLEPNMVSTYSFLGYDYALKNQMDSSFYFYNKVLELLPNEGYIYNSMAINYKRMGDENKMFDYFKKAVAVDSNLLVPFLNLSREYFYGKKDFPNAIYYGEKGMQAVNRMKQVKYEDYLFYSLDETLSLNSILIMAYKEIGDAVNAAKLTANMYEVCSRPMDLLAVPKAMRPLIDVKREEACTVLTGFLEKSIALSEDSLRVDSRPEFIKKMELMSGLTLLGAVNRVLKKYDEAEKIFKKSIEKFPKRSLTNGFMPTYEVLPSLFVGGTINAYMEMAMIRIEQNKPEDALVWIEMGIQSGFRDTTFLSKQPAFKLLQETDAFKALKAKYFTPTADKK